MLDDLSKHQSSRASPKMRAPSISVFQPPHPRPHTAQRGTTYLHLAPEGRGHGTYPKPCRGRTFAGMLSLS